MDFRLSPRATCYQQLFRIARLVLFTCIALGTAVGASASEDHDHAHIARPAVQVSSLDDAVNALAHFQREVIGYVKSGELQKIHGAAFDARDAATSVVQFARDLPDTAQRELASHAQRIAALAVQLDKYGDAGKATETAAVAERFAESVAAVEKSAGITGRTDWKPVYLEAAPSGGHGGHGHSESKCPHKANHGGRFTLALNDAYHVEGSYPAPGEFRLHFYDKDSCPIPAHPFKGFLLLQDARERVELQPAADGSHLVGRLPSPVEPPLSLTAIVQLPHPEHGQVSTEHFSYNLYRLSRPAAPQKDTVTSSAQVAEKQH